MINDSLNTVFFLPTFLQMVLQLNIINLALSDSVRSIWLKYMISYIFHDLTHTDRINEHNNLEILEHTFEIELLIPLACYIFDA